MTKHSENTEPSNSTKPVLAVVNDDKSFEQFLKEEIEAGYMSENGSPIKCHCGCTDFKEVDKYHENGHVVEYALECKNEDCLKIVGRWSYGSWLL